MGLKTLLVAGLALATTSACDVIERGPTSTIVSQASGANAPLVLWTCVDRKFPQTAEPNAENVSVKDFVEFWQQSTPEDKTLRQLEMILSACPLHGAVQAAAIAGVIDDAATVARMAINQQTLDQTRRRLLFAIDARFYDYVENVLETDRNASFIPQVVDNILPAGAIAGQIGGQALGAVSLISNTFGTYQTSALSGLQMAGFVNQMQADRVEAKKKVGDATLYYELMIAMSEYEAAGTFQSAINAQITEEKSAQSRFD